MFSLEGRDSLIKLEVIAPKKLIADPVKLLAAIKQGVQDTVDEGQRYISEYPPQTLVKTGYHRTMTLNKSWSDKVDQTGDRTEGIVGSNSGIAPYNRWVQGTTREQVMMFAQAGWRGVADLKAKMEVDLPKNIQRNINKAAKKL